MASDWPHTFFTARLFLFSIIITPEIVLCMCVYIYINYASRTKLHYSGHMELPAGKFSHLAEYLILV